MPHLANLQLKVKAGYKLTPEELLFMEKSANEDGVPSRRKFEGWKEYPDSVMDFEI